MQKSSTTKQTPTFADPSKDSKKSSHLTQAELKEVLHYDPDTGIFTRLKAHEPKYVGKPAGHINTKGYVIIKIGQKAYKAHRLAFLYVYGSWPQHQVDHVNQDKADNRIKNLRNATNSQNQHNCKKRAGNNPYKGVSKNSSGKGWEASITVNYKPHYLGYFKTPEEAYESYKQAAKKLHGEFFCHG